MTDSDVGEIEERRVEEFQSLLLGWYEDHRRSFIWRTDDVSDYKVTIAELCLQRTTASAVEDVLPEFFSQFPDWKSLAEADVSEVQNTIRPLGLWRRRGRRMKALAQEIVQRDCAIPYERSEAENLPGIGQYVASAILLMCHGKREPLLDANMARVLERVFGERNTADIRHDSYLQNLSRKILQGVDPVAINLAVLDLGALVCKPKSPKCGECPLTELCSYYQATRTLET